MSTELMVKANKNHSITLVYKDALGNIIDITGGVARLAAREGYYTPILVDVTATINGPIGEMVFNFVPTDTTNILEDEKLSEKRLICDVELTLDAKKIDIFDEVYLLVKQTAVR